MVFQPFNLEKQLSFYGAYHSNKVNVGIHIVCVPLIVWSLGVLLVSVTPPGGLLDLLPPEVRAGLSVYVAPRIPDALKTAATRLDPSLGLDWYSAFLGVYWMYYMILDPVAGMLILPIMMLSHSGAHSFVNAYPARQSAGAADFLISKLGLPPPASAASLAGFSAAQIAAVLHAFSWIMQFIGHGKFEGRAPALLDNLLGAVVLAPFFVFLEILFLVGYRPNLQKRVKNETGKLITQFRRQRTEKARAQAGNVEKKME